jgi:hypothetical protein
MLRIAMNVIEGRPLDEFFLTDEVAAMRLRTYRDQSCSQHFDLVGAGPQPWTIDLVSVMASAVLVVGFACALLAPWVG